MDPAFEVHMLTEEGKKKAHAIAEAFDELLRKITPEVMDPRDLALARTHLEIAGFFAKKGMAKGNSQAP